METEKKIPELKHLGFVRMAAIQALVCVSNLYDYAKQNSRPLRSIVGTVEGAVTFVVGPVYRKFKDLPDDLLVFVDKKVDEVTHKFDEHAPPIAKKAANQAQSLLNVAVEKFEKFVHEARVGGPRAALHYVATESKRLALIQSVKLYIKVNQFPVIHTVVDVTLPTAIHWSEKYNHTVKDLTLKGYTIFGYLPLVPIDEISKTFKQSKAEEKHNNATWKSDSSDSD